MQANTVLSKQHSLYNLLTHSVSLHTYVLTHTHTHTHARTHAHARTHTHTRMHTHTRTHARTHTHTHTHTHLHAQQSPLSVSGEYILDVKHQYPECRDHDDTRGRTRIATVCVANRRQSRCELVVFG